MTLNEARLDEVRQYSKRIGHIDEDIQAINAKMDALKAAKIKLSEERIVKANVILENMKFLDVASNGNYGWEVRVINFLSKIASE